MTILRFVTPLILLIILAYFIVFILINGNPILFHEDKNMTQKEEIQKTEWADKYFREESPQLYNLTRRIELKQPITVDEIKALPEGALNKRYKGDITLLFFALNVFNAQAIDVLLEAGADPYMVDSPKTGSKRDFAVYFAMYSPSEESPYNPTFVNSILASYLKHGGDPNHHTNYYILANLAMAKDYDGIKMVVKAGGDLFQPHDRLGFSGAIILADDPYPEGQQCLSDLIDAGYLDGRPTSFIDRMLLSLQPFGSGDLLSTMRNRYAKLNAEKMLARYPDVTENYATEKIFDGPIPWKEIHAGNFTDPQTGERRSNSQ